MWAGTQRYCKNMQLYLVIILPPMKFLLVDCCMPYSLYTLLLYQPPLASSPIKGLLQQLSYFDAMTNTIFLMRGGNEDQQKSNFNFSWTNNDNNDYSTVCSAGCGQRTGNYSLIWSGLRLWFTINLFVTRSMVCSSVTLVVLLK